MYLKPKGDKIAQCRKELGYTRYALSVKLGLGKYAIARMEEEKHNVHHLRAKVVADGLGRKVEDLFEPIEPAKEEQQLKKVSGM